MSYENNLPKLLRNLGDPDTCTVKEKVFTICKSYSFPIVLHSIAEDVITCRCNPFCRIDLASMFLRLCPDDYLRSFNTKEFDLEKEKHTVEGCREGEEYFNDFLRIESHADAEEFADREFYDYTEEDFPKAAIKATAGFNFFTLLFQRLSPMDFFSPKQFLDLTAPLITKAAAHSSFGPWTSNSSAKGAHELLESLSTYCSCYSLSELLVWSPLPKTKYLENFQYTHSIFGKILLLNRSRLLKEKWPKNPLAKSAFCWCLKQVKHPYLSSYLDQILVPVLLFVDDFTSEHKIAGLKCLDHIMKNVSQEELRWYNRHAVIFDALKHQLYTQDAIVLENVLPCLLSVLSVIEKNPLNSENMDYNHYDEIFELILYNSEMENKLAFRRIYTSFIPTFIDIMGISCVRHMKALLRIIEYYLEIYDGPYETARLNVLRTLQKIIEVAWPRVDNHIDFLVKVLLKLLYDVVVEDVIITSGPVKKQLVNKTIEILCDLKKVNGQRIEELLTAVSGKIDVAGFQLAVESVLESNFEEKSSN